MINIVAIDCIDIDYRIKYTLEAIYIIIKTNKINLFKMVMSTSTINMDANFIQNKQEIIQKMASSSHNPNYTHRSNTAFMDIAFRLNAWDILLYLLSFDDIILHSDNTETSKYPYTPNAQQYAREWISFRGKSKVLECLIKHKNFNHNIFIHQFGSTMLQCALIHLQYFRAHPNSVSEKTLKSMTRVRREIIDFLLKPAHCQQSINHPDTYFQKDRTALHMATIFMDVETVDKLLKIKNIDYNIRDEDGYTPLMLACQLSKSYDYAYQTFISTPQVNMDQNLLSAMVTLFLQIDDCDVLSNRKGFDETCLTIALESSNDAALIKICEYLSHRYHKSDKDKEAVIHFFKTNMHARYSTNSKFAKSTSLVKDVMSSEVFQLYNEMFV